MYFFVKNTSTDGVPQASPDFKLGDELSVPDPKLGLVATYSREGNFYSLQDAPDHDDDDPEETEYETASEAGDTDSDTDITVVDSLDMLDKAGLKLSEQQPEQQRSIFSSVSRLASFATSTEPQSSYFNFHIPSLALEVGLPKEVDAAEENKKRTFQLNLGLIKIALYDTKVQSKGTHTIKRSRPVQRSRVGKEQWVVRMPSKCLSARYLRVYPDGHVLGNFEYAMHILGLKIGVGLYRPVQAFRYRIDRFGVRHGQKGVKKMSI